LQLETSSFCAKEENASRNTVETTDLLAQCQKATGTEEKNTLQERLYLPTLIVSVKAVSLSKQGQYLKRLLKPENSGHMQKHLKQIQRFCYLFFFPFTVLKRTKPYSLIRH